MKANIKIQLPGNVKNVKQALIPKEMLINVQIVQQEHQITRQERVHVLLALEIPIQVVEPKHVQNATPQEKDQMLLILHVLHVQEENIRIN